MLTYKLQNKCYFINKDSVSLESHAWKRPATWNWFHKTWNYSLPKNVILWNWKSQCHMERLLRNCHNVKMGRTVSHNFSFVHDAAIFSLEDGESMFLRNVSVYLWVYMASQPRRTSSSHPWVPQILSCVLNHQQIIWLKLLITLNQFHADFVWVVPWACSFEV
jgi:hypothetical protein